MTVALQLRPAATLIDNSTHTGTLHGVISDGFDASYATNASGISSKVRLAASVLPAGAIVQSVRLSMRMRRAVDGNWSNASLNGKAAMLLTPPTGSFATIASAPQGGFTAADVAAGITLTWNSNGPGNLDLADAWIIVTYVARPTVDVIEPSGTTPVTQPIVSWAMSGDAPQSLYQAKIFSQAQYEAPGFNVDASTAVYESGVQLGNTDSIVPTSVNLLDDTTYRFYVRAAQQIGAGTQWSNWAFETATVDAIPPEIPELTCTPENDLARIKLVAGTQISPPGGGFGLGPFGSGPFGGGFHPHAGESVPDWRFVTIERTSDGGATWATVRSANRAATFGATFIAYDYESCNGERVQYRVRAIATAGGQDVASDWSPLSIPVAWTSAATWFKAPTRPALNRVVKINGIPELKRRNPQGTFDVPNRADPIVLSAGRKLTEGAVTFVTETLDELDGMTALLDLSETLLLQTPESHGFGCKYLACGDSTERRVVRRAQPEARYVEVPFLEVLAPVGEIVGFGVTWADIGALYATWDDLIAANPTWADVLHLT